MIPKYKIEYGVTFRKQTERAHYETEDPVTCEDFLSHLLERGFNIFEVKHEGVALPMPEFDRMVKAAANSLAARHICASLNIKGEEEHFRFGFAV